MNIGSLLKKGAQSFAGANVNAFNQLKKGVSSGVTGLSSLGNGLASAAPKVASLVPGGKAATSAGSAVGNTMAKVAAASKVPSPSAAPVAQAKAPATGGGGSWGTTAPATVATAPKATTAYKAPAAQPVVAPQPQGDGFTSADPLVQARIKQMQSQADDSQFKTALAPSGTLNASFNTNQRPPEVLNEVQNADGTITKYYDDGSKSVVKLNERDDKLYSPEEVSSTDYKGNLAELLRNQPDDTVTAARSRLLGLYGPSSEESQYQDELTTAQENARLGNVGLEGQGRGIPLALVRGQQGKLNEQAAIGQQTIIQRLAAAQAKRQAEQQIASQELGYATSDQASQVQQSQFEKNLALQQAGQANTLQAQMLNAGYIPAQKGFQASAGQQTYQVGGQTYVKAPGKDAESFTLSEGQQRYDAQGKLIAGTPKQVDPLDAQERTLRMQKLMQDMEGGDPLTRQKAMYELEKLEKESQTGAGATDAARDMLLQKKGLIEGLLTGEGMGGAVGTAGIDRIKLWGVNKGKVQNFVAGVEQLTSQETMKALADLKARGATLGALSDKELQLLYSSASKIGSWRRQDKAGNIYYAARESDFKKELNNLLALTQKGLQDIPGGQQQYGDLDPSTFTADDFLYMQSQGIDPSVFTKAPSKAVNGSIGSLSEKFESGGNPGAVGYDSTGGLSYGTYQLAHNNANRFVQSSPFKKFFEGIKFNSQQFVNKWKEVAQAIPQEFAKAQHDFIAATHFFPQLQKIAQAGLGSLVKSPVLKEVIWSTAVQHGAATNLIVQALKALPAHASEADKIKAIYNARWNGGRSFGSSTPAVRQAVFNRFFGPNGEMNQALRRLNG